MMRCVHIALSVLLACVVALTGISSAIANPAVPEFTLKDIVRDDAGYLLNTGSDGYLVLTDLGLPRTEACGLLLDIEFAEPLQRPAIFDIFWRTPGSGGFSERLKAFVVVDYQDSVARARYVVPLCKLYHFGGNTNRPELQRPLEGLRLDYPVNQSIGLKFHAFEFIDAQRMLRALNDDDVVVLEPYERVSPNAFTSLDVALPKLVFAFEDGARKMRGDPLFVGFWLLLMLALLGLIVRSYWPLKNDD